MEAKPPPGHNSNGVLDCERAVAARCQYGKHRERRPDQPNPQGTPKERTVRMVMVALGVIRNPSRVSFEDRPRERLKPAAPAARARQNGLATIAVGQIP
jgi:hypothetical protein